MTLSGLESLLTGRTLCDRYRVGPVIGRGGMGVVYQGLDTRLQRPVAIKVLSLNLPDPRAESILRSRLAREGRIAAGIRHPNVVAVFDHGTDPTLQLDFLVMELLEGEDVARRIKRAGVPTLATSIDIFRWAADGLAAGHRVGLVHRDIKPANLFLESGARSGEPTLKVLDFGIAQAGPDADMTVTVAGDAPHPLSPAFASLEQLSGASRLTPASDVYSLGAVAYYLITGQRAFRSSEPPEVRSELRQSLRALKEDTRLPGSLVSTIERCLAEDPAQRFPSAEELLGSLRELHARSGYAGAGASIGLTSAESGASVGVAHSEHRASVEAARVENPASAAPDRDSGGVAAANPDAVERNPPVWQPRLTRAAEKTLPGLLGGSVVAALAGLITETPGMVVLSVIAAMVLLPWFIHRRRGRGSARFAILATAVVTMLAIALMRGGVGDAGGYSFVTIVQLVMASAASWLSAAPPPPPQVQAEAEAPSSNLRDSW